MQKNKGLCPVDGLEDAEQEIRVYAHLLESDRDFIKACVQDLAVYMHYNDYNAEVTRLENQLKQTFMQTPMESYTDWLSETEKQECIKSVVKRFCVFLAVYTSTYITKISVEFHSNITEKCVEMLSNQWAYTADKEGLMRTAKTYIKLALAKSYAQRIIFTSLITNVPEVKTSVKGAVWIDRNVHNIEGLQKSVRIMIQTIGQLETADSNGAFMIKFKHITV